MSSGARTEKEAHHFSAETHIINFYLCRRKKESCARRQFYYFQLVFARLSVCCVNFAAISGKQIYNKKGGGTSKRSNKVIK